MSEDDAEKLADTVAALSDARLGEVWLFNAVPGATSKPDSIFRRLQAAVKDEMVRRIRKAEGSLH